MPLNQRASKKIKTFNLPLSFRVNESREVLRDALNVFSNQGRLETRHGSTLHTAISLSAPVLSLSYFKNANAENFLIAKVGDSLYKISADGEHEVLKTGLSAGTKHRGITLSRGLSSRHIIAIEGDGLFQFDGLEFTQLGQNPPAAPIVAATGGSMTAASYQVGMTFYSSKTGFETNLGTMSSSITVTSSQGIRVTGIPATADNATIDTVCFYLKKVGTVGQPVYAGETSLGAANLDITTDPLSTEIPPTANMMPLSGGGKFITEFNRSLVYAGNNEFKNDVFFSEPDLADAFNDGTADGRLVLYASLGGSITGLATGLYNNSVLDPFLVVFKRRSTQIYSEINGEGKLVTISSEIGCVSHDTIKVKNGIVYFLSDQGWRMIANGNLVTDQQNNPVTLGMGDIDDIFRTPGYAYEVNRSRMSDAFSVYYSALDQYITWVAEGAENKFEKAYVYEFNNSSFKAYKFPFAATCACTGEDNDGNEQVYMGDEDGNIFRHSINEQRQDLDSSGEAAPIEAFAIMTWMDGDDIDASFNFRELLLRRLAGSGDLTVKGWINYGSDEAMTETLVNKLEGFFLDVSVLDVDTLGGSDRSLLTHRADIHLVGENLMIGFFQNEVGRNLGLVSAQIDFSKNGNRN